MTEQDSKRPSAEAAQETGRELAHQAEPSETELAEQELEQVAGGGGLSGGVVNC